MPSERLGAGRVVGTGTYLCVRCGFGLRVENERELAPCPWCANREYEVVHAGDTSGGWDRHPNGERSEQE